MRSIRSNVFPLIAVVSALLCTAGAYVISASAAGARCTSGACTYFATNGRGLPGTCGQQKGDNKNCYCIANDDKKLRQVQSGCSVSR
jgi:hypothetical protein